MYSLYATFTLLLSSFSFRCRLPFAFESLSKHFKNFSNGVYGICFGDQPFTDTTNSWLIQDTNLAPIKYSAVRMHSG